MARPCCAVLHGVRDVRVEEAREHDLTKVLGPNDVRLAPRKTGICGSDLHWFSHGRIGAWVMTEPKILGHETAGEIVEVGAAVKTLKVGDRVALEPALPCGECELCKGGLYPSCQAIAFPGRPAFPGSLNPVMTVPASFCYPLPPTMSLEIGAMIEPFAVGLHALHSVAKLRTNDTICVFGAGPVGILTMAAAQALGARRIVAIDIQKARLDFATSYAATDSYLAGKMLEGEDSATYAQRSVKEMMAALDLPVHGPGSVDVAVDCSGAESCSQMGILVLKPAGTFVQVGMGKAFVTLPLETVIIKSLSIKGSWRYGPGIFALAIDLVARGRVDLLPLITHRFSFVNVAKAFEAAASGKGEDGKAVMKVMIDGPMEH